MNTCPAANRAAERAHAWYYKGRLHDAVGDEKTADWFYAVGDFYYKWYKRNNARSVRHG